MAGDGQRDGEIPVLDHRGLKLTQSGIILDYLSQHFGVYGGTTPEERREINAISGVYQDGLDNLATKAKWEAR